MEKKIIKAEKDKDMLATKKIVSLTIRYFRVIPPIIMIIILSSGYLFLIKPKVENVRGEIAAEIETKQQEYEAAKTSFNDLSDTKRAYQKIKKEDIERLNIMLPDKFEIETMLVKMESLIKGEGFILNNITVTNNTPVVVSDKKKQSAKLSIPKEVDMNAPLPSEIGVMSVSLGVAGIDSYESFKRFLNIIENNIKLFDLYKTSIKSSGEAMSIILTTYYSNIGS